MALVRRDRYAWLERSMLVAAVTGVAAASMLLVGAVAALVLRAHRPATG